MEAKSFRLNTDLELARAAASGSPEAWEEFVLRYSALILATVRRFMRGFSTDDHRTVYVEVLKQFRDSELLRYDGSVTLSSWIMIVTRSRCMDTVRARRGRRRLPTWLRHLPQLEREVFRLYYVEWRDLPTTHALLQWLGYDLPIDAIPQILDRLDARMDSRLRRQLAYELQARSVGGVTAQLLEFLDEFQARSAETEEDARPDSILIEREARSMLARVRSLVEQLPSDERRAVELYYWRGLRAEDVARRMDLGGRRRAQGLIARALIRLRRMLQVEGQERARGRFSAEDFRPYCRGGEQ